MLAVWPLWVVLAAVFLALSLLTRKNRRELAGEYIKWAVWTKSPLTAAGIGKAIDDILWVEVIGFFAAAVAALASILL